MVEYNSDTSTLSCIFLNELDASAKSCSVMYGQCGTKLEQNAPTENSNDTVLKVTLQDVVLPTCYIVKASNSTVSVIVEGSIKGM